MASRSPEEEVRRLRKDADWALRQALDPTEIVPILHHLARVAPPESEHFSYAHRHLAELSVESHPWRAALSARHVLARFPDDDRAWAVLGLSYTLLGYYKAAAAAYHHAVILTPGNPWYSHNLGHLLDVAMDRPAEAIPLLAAALRKEPKESEIASSYAHALGRVGRLDDARKVLKRYLKNGGTAEQKALMRWLEAGASENEPDRAPRRKRTRARSANAGATRRRSTKPAPGR